MTGRPIKHTTSEDQLANFLSKKLPFSFRGIYSSNELMSSPRALGWPDQLPHAFIANTDSNNLPGKHWIAIYVTSDGQGEVMDSYGLLPPTPVQRWLNEYTRRWTYNTYLIQPPESDTCGQFCADYLIRRSYCNSMDCVLAMFSVDLHSNERSVLSRIKI
jgi:hypothetical protein